MSGFTLPPMGFGPGSQAHEADLPTNHIPLPQGMRTYIPHLPEVEEVASVAPAMALLARIAEACDRAVADGATEVFDVAQLDPASRRFLAETLGEGEVSVRMLGVPAIAAQESVFAGVWSLAGSGVDRVEVAPLPSLAQARAFVPRRPRSTSPTPEVLMSAPAIVTELEAKSAAWTPADGLHVVNLTLLPHSPEDLLWLDTTLGEGSVTILSRGYGNCRITATALPQVWRVQFFNSMDTPILDTFEVTAVPEVALAAPEDLSDSAKRIRDLLEQLQ
ncbi:hydrogenase expression/formation protein [Rubellimicrobium arenae]|uniref:hydrogenase expression/formation protein n=1 Tax=Rubellimicrobium arenae TaxID=2817372 RepID=UPI001B30D82C|nr:hydrogenase expression/formation protein [Rubellimicrobium arenae]